MNNITICYLHWKRNKILENTLQSHLQNGLYDHIKHKIIFFQEINVDKIKIAKKYNIEYIGDIKNIGILNAFIKLINKCKTKYILFCENDWILTHDNTYIKNILEDSVKLLKNNLTDLIKLRDRQDPGSPLYSKPYFKKFLKNVNDFPYKLESLNWIKNPENIYSKDIFTIYNYNFTWYNTTFIHQQWSNNPFIANVKYLQDCIIPIIIEFTSDNDKYGSLEDRLSKSIQSGRICGGEGLFTHKDRL